MQRTFLRKGVRKAVLILSSGHSTELEQLKKTVKKAKEEGGVRLYYIAIQGNVDEAMLDMVAPGSTHLVVGADRLLENIGWVDRIFE